jgi:histone-lysine N-methyltransferase SETMAR
VTGETYKVVLRTKFLPALREKRPQNAVAVLLHRDNALPQQAARVYQFFKENNLEVLPHAPHSPDLTPSDFWLFPTQKDTLWSHIFELFRSWNSHFSVVTTNPQRSVCCGHAIVTSAS